MPIIRSSRRQSGSRVAAGWKLSAGRMDECPDRTVVVVVGGSGGGVVVVGGGGGSSSSSSSIVLINIIIKKFQNFQ